MASLFLEAGFPAGLVSILAEDIETAVEAVEQGPDKVVVTGSFEAGASIVSRLAPSVVPATLELGGCDAVFVRRDADVDLASRALTFGLAFAGGETCIAPRRVFAARELSDELEARLATAVGALAARPLRRAAVEKAAELIRDACERGARPAAGTHPVPAEGRMRPVVLAGVAPGMRVLSEDVLAPLLAIVPVRDDEQALRLASACPYALGAAVFGKEAGAVALARRVNAGTAIVNDVIVPTADPRLPFSGRGRSGHGVTRGAEGLLEMTRIKALSVRRSFRRHLDAVPPVRERDDLFLLYIQAAHAPGLRARVRAAVSLGRLLARSRERRAGEFGARS